MKPTNTLLASTGTTIFAIMSNLATRHGAINLGQGFPDTEGAPDVVHAAAEFLADQRNQYPPLTGLPELRQAVAASNRRFYGLDVDAETDVVVTSGATEALTACLMSLLDPDDEIVLIEPLYDTYLPVVRLLGAIPRLVRLTPPNWDLPRAELAAAFGPKTKAILFNSPMNPTGKVFRLEELEFIAGLLHQHDAYAICDEVYEHLVFGNARHIPLMTLPGMRERCLRIGSAGKTFSLTGWKVGYVSTTAALATAVAKAHQNLTFSTPPNLQRAVAIGLGRDDSYFEKLAGDLAERRDRLADGLETIGMKVSRPEGSYFISADFSQLYQGDDLAFCKYITEHAGVTGIPMSAFYAGDAPRNFARFAFCKQPKVLDEVVRRLGHCFGGTTGRGERKNLLR